MPFGLFRAVSHYRVLSKSDKSTRCEIRPLDKIALHRTIRQIRFKQSDFDLFREFESHFGINCNFIPIVAHRIYFGFLNFKNLLEV